MFCWRSLQPFWGLCMLFWPCSKLNALGKERPRHLIPLRVSNSEQVWRRPGGSWVKKSLCLLLFPLCLFQDYTAGSWGLLWLGWAKTSLYSGPWAWVVSAPPPSDCSSNSRSPPKGLEACNHMQQFSVIPGEVNCNLGHLLKRKWLASLLTLSNCQVASWKSPSGDFQPSGGRAVVKMKNKNPLPGEVNR